MHSERYNQIRARVIGDESGDLSNKAPTKEDVTSLVYEFQNTWFLRKTKYTPAEVVVGDKEISIRFDFVPQYNQISELTIPFDSSKAPELIIRNAGLESKFVNDSESFNKNIADLVVRSHESYNESLMMIKQAQPVAVSAI